MRFFLFLLLLTPTLAFAQQEFVPLTNIPGLTDVGNSPTLEVFLNNLYRICIGLAAVLAVLQIIRAGITYMLGDSFTEKKEARSMIAMAVFGLVLVLSPVIVFSVINRDILSLRIDVSGLKSATQSTAERVMWLDTSKPRSESKARCEQEGGLPVALCIPADGGDPRPESSDSNCKVGEKVGTACMEKSSDSNTNTCNYKAIKDSVNGSCSAVGYGYQKISSSCCTSGSCCGTTEDVTTHVYGWSVVNFAHPNGSTLNVNVKNLPQAACIESRDLWRMQEGLTEGAVTYTCNCDSPLKEQSGCNF